MVQEAVDTLNADPECIKHCWASTLLLRRWERQVQMEAVRKADCDTRTDYIIVDLAIFVLFCE